MPQSRFINVTNMSLNAIRENKILAKISEFTVLCLPSKMPHIYFNTGIKKFRIDQDFLIEHWPMIYIMPVVFAEIYVRMKLKLNFRNIISIN